MRTLGDLHKWGGSPLSSRPPFPAPAGKGEKSGAYRHTPNRRQDKGINPYPPTPFPHYRRERGPWARLAAPLRAACFAGEEGLYFAEKGLKLTHIGRSYEEPLICDSEDVGHV